MHTFLNLFCFCFLHRCKQELPYDVYSWEIPPSDRKKDKLQADLETFVNYVWHAGTGKCLGSLNKL